MEDDTADFSLNLREEVESAVSYEKDLRLLVQMGFDESDAAAAYIYGRTLDGTIEFLTADHSVQNHSFISGDGADVCAICFRSQGEHTSSMPAPIPESRPVRDVEWNKCIWIDASQATLYPADAKDEKARDEEGEITCEICFCDYQLEEMVELSCGHLFCRDCIRGWLSSQICDGKVSAKQISCPNIDCRKEISPQIVLFNTEKSVFEKYERFVMNREVETNKKARWCGNPSNCESVVFIKNTLSKKCVCKKCGFVQCFKCGKAYHGYFKACTADVDRAFDVWARTQDNMKRCPRCRKFIVKIDGCNHMTCSCGYQFCWVCGGAYYSGHFAPFNPFGCPGMQFAATRGICHNGIFCRIAARLVLSTVFLTIAAIALALGLSAVGIVFSIQLSILTLAFPIALFIWLMKGPKPAGKFLKRACCLRRF